VKLEQSFEVDAPVDTVWQALIDVERVAPSLPGAAVTGRNDDGTYNGTFTIKIGPTTASYTGKLEMREVDEEARSATLHAQGTDKRGQGGANATIVSNVTEAGEGKTRVEVDTDYHITGRLARFGRGGMIEDISERLLKEFAARLQSSLAQAPGEDAEAPSEGEQGPAPPPPTDGPPPPPTEAPAGPPPPPTAAPPPPPPGEAPPPPRPGEAPPPPRPEPSEPLQAHEVVGSVLLERIRANPWPLIGLGVVVLLIRRRRRRRRDVLMP
jgi:carbon monoxide dehydrogenase subunit G